MGDSSDIDALIKDMNNSNLSQEENSMVNSILNELNGAPEGGAVPKVTSQQQKPQITDEEKEMLMKQQMQEQRIAQQRMQQQMMQNPQAIQMQQRIQQITSQIESRKAKLIAEMMIDYAKEEDKISSEVGGDPLLKLKSRELDIKAKNDQEQAANREARLDLDTMRAMMNDQQHDEKREQNEELAGLRAGVSLAKQTMADQSKIHDFGRNFKKK